MGLAIFLGALVVSTIVLVGYCALAYSRRLDDGERLPPPADDERCSITRHRRILSMDDVR